MMIVRCRMTRRLYAVTGIRNATMLVTWIASGIQGSRPIIDSERDIVLGVTA